MSITGIQNELLEVTVVRCNGLKDTEWITKQDPYVRLEYGGNKYGTSTCKDGDKDPIFEEKFEFNLIEGLTEIDVSVWNSNTFRPDKFIGSGKIQLQKVLSHGYDDNLWPIFDQNMRTAGEVKLILHYSNAPKPSTSFASLTAPPYVTPPISETPLFFRSLSTPPPAAHYAPPVYLAHSHSLYPPNSAVYSPSPYSTPPPAGYPPPSYPPTSVYPPGHYPGTYRPPPY